jgi:tetratricopeptide (TPR) repeat protein
MKNWIRPRAFVALLLFCLTSSLHGQGGVAKFHSNALTAMNAAKRQGMPAGAENWQKALAELTKATDAYDGRALKLFGPKFGWFWYHRGFCELKLKMYGEAIKSFQTCYEKYGNEGAEGGNANIYHKKALLKWGEAAQGKEDWKTAVDKYEQFLKERDPARDDFPKGAFNINMAVCNFKTGQIPEGLNFFKTAIKNKNRFPTPPSGIMAGFQVFAEAVIAKKDEEALLDFLQEHRDDVVFQPWEAAPFSPIFMSLAANALQAGLRSVAFELYALVPDSMEAEDSLRAAISRLGGFDRPVPDGASIYLLGSLEQELALVRERETKGLLPEVSALAATAYIHEQAGNVRGAYVAYKMLEENFRSIPRDKRENYLYQLVRTSSLVGRVLETNQYGQEFLDDFPGSENEDTVRNLMLTGLFFDGEYEKCLEVAGKQIEILEEGTEQHDICLHVLGGSYYYTGQFNKAMEHLKKHVELYPESKFKIAADYFYASNFVQLQIWRKAGELLDKFLAKYPNPKDNDYLPFAMYDRANTHFAQEEYAQALEMLNTIENDFPNASNREMVFNLKGNILQNQGEYAEAGAYYERALKLAERKNNRVVAGESLFYLVGMLGQEKRGNEPNEQMAEALPYYDRFFADYGSDSPYKAQVAVAGLPALEAADRTQEGLDRLQEVISQMAKVPGSFGLEEAINSFTKFYLKGHSEEELKDLYYDFPGIRFEDRAAQALLRIAVITVFEDKAEAAAKENNESDASKSNAMVKVLFRDLKTDFEIETLSNFILVSVGDYLREKTSSPKQAIPYYEEALGRSDQSYRFDARFGLADVYGRSDSDADLQKAVTSLLSVYDNSGEKKQQEKALYRAVEVLAKMGEWEKAKARAKEYLDKDKNYGEFAALVSYTLGKAYRELGQTENAIATFGGVQDTYRGVLSVSAPSVKAYMELLWDRNTSGGEDRPSDRQFAYQIGAKFLEQTTRIRNNSKVPDAEKALWDEVQTLTRRYEANPNIESLSQGNE